MVSSNIKAQRLLDKLKEPTGLTEDGKNWFIAAVDPFHDTPVSLAGYPDNRSTATIVQNVKRQCTISRPPTVPAGSTWDANFVLYPTTANMGLNNVFGMIGDTYSSTGDTGSTTGNTFGAMTVYTGPQGAQMLPTGTTRDSAGVYTIGLDPGAEFTRGNFRVLGMAFEVVNTTSDNFANGSVTCYKVPGTPSPRNWIDTSRIIGYQTIPLPPTKLSDTVNYLGTVTWSAKEGCYVVSRMNDLNNPINQTSYAQVMLDCSDHQTGDDSTTFQNYTVANTAPYDGAARIATKVLPFDTSGAYFTGLSPETTLNLNVRWIIERAPTIHEPTLQVMTSPSAVYDPFALQLYSKALSLAPVGVTVAENPMGEWFKSLVDSVSKWASPVGAALSAVGVPYAGAVGGGLSSLAKQLSGMLSPSPMAKLQPPPLPPRNPPVLQRIPRLPLKLAAKKKKTNTKQ